MSTDGGPSDPGRGVQSVHRAFDIVEALHGSGGELSISDLAAATALPMPTIHRLLKTMAERGYIRQLPNRRYALGFRFVPLAGLARTTVGHGAERILTDLVTTIGETANLAALSGDHAQYVAQVPSPHAMRMFTEVGRVVDLHATGVGKALLAGMDPAQVQRIARMGLPARTEFTLTTEPDLMRALAEIRERGYAVDEQEQMLGVRCVAVALDGPLSWLAVSVSGPALRMTDQVVERAVPLLREAAARLVTGIGARAQDG